MFYSIKYKNGYLAASNLFGMFTKSIISSIIHSIIPYVLRVQIIEKYDWLNKNEWLLLPATFTAKFGLVFGFYENLFQKTKVPFFT